MNFIETLFENAKSKNADISACNYYCDYNDGRIVNRPNKPNKKDFDNLQAVRDLLLENSTLETILCNKLFKRKLFMDNNLKLIEGEIYEDTRIMYRLAFYAQKITFINKPLYYYLLPRVIAAPGDLLGRGGEPGAHLHQIGSHVLQRVHTFEPGRAHSTAISG